MMEAEGVPVSTTQLIIGHERSDTMGTTALYAKGARMQKELRKAINKVRYSPELMKLIRMG
jgi:hypothetical protein